MTPEAKELRATSARDVQPRRTSPLQRYARRQEEGATMRTAALFETYDHRHHDAARAAIGDIVAVCRDGELGYTQAAEDVRDARLKELFKLFADQRRSFTATLERHAIWLGDTPEAIPRVRGWIHRKWLDA